MAAQAQKARCSSRVRSRRLPSAGSSAQVRAVSPLAMTARRSSCPPAVNASPGCAFAQAVSRTAEASRSAAADATRTGRTGSRSRVRWSILALRRDSSFACGISSARTGQGAAHCAHRDGSSTAHWAMSR
jgi:hypothetical protein